MSKKELIAMATSVLVSSGYRVFEVSAFTGPPLPDVDLAGFDSEGHVFAIAIAPASVAATQKVAYIDSLDYGHGAIIESPKDIATFVKGSA